MPLVEIKDFNASIDNKVFFDQPIKKNKKHMKNLSKYQKMVTTQQEIYWIFRIIKVAINLLVQIYQDKQIHVFLNKSILQEKQEMMVRQCSLSLKKQQKTILNFSLDSLIVKE